MPTSMFGATPVGMSWSATSYVFFSPVHQHPHFPTSNHRVPTSQSQSRHCSRTRIDVQTSVPVANRIQSLPQKPPYQTFRNRNKSPAHSSTATPPKKPVNLCSHDACQKLHRKRCLIYTRHHGRHHHREYRRPRGAAI